MSRTRVRIVLILIAFILIVAAILSGVLTYWVGAGGVPASTPEPGEADRCPVASWQAIALHLPSLRSPFTVG